MNRQKLVLLVLTLLLIAGTGVTLAHLRTHQRLGAPGVRTHPLPGSTDRLVVDLPPEVLDYKSEWRDVDDITRTTLPPDTSFGQRLYHGPDDFQILLNVVLMGGDRTSLHKPQFCLEGQGFHIDQPASRAETVRVQAPQPYDLPVVALVSNGEVERDGTKQRVRGIYLYWYVADDALSAGELGFQRMLLMATRLLRTGVLQRWAYVSCFSLCLPGQEQTTIERMKQFIAAAAPGFQLYPKPAAVPPVAAANPSQ